MAMFRNYILGIAGLCFLIQCADEKQTNETSPASLLSPFAQTPNTLAGEWEYSNSIYYAAKLRLNPDRTFTYRNETCYGQSFTEGKWRENNGTIVLTSDESFRPVEKEKAQKKAKDTGLKEGTFIFIGFDEMETSRFPGPNDTIRVYFKNVRLNLKSDTLYSASDNVHISEHKFNRVTNNR